MIHTSLADQDEVVFRTRCVRELVGGSNALKLHEPLDLGEKINVFISATAEIVLQNINETIDCRDTSSNKAVSRHNRRRAMAVDKAGVGKFMDLLKQGNMIPRAVAVLLYSSSFQFATVSIFGSSPKLRQNAGSISTRSSCCSSVPI